MNCLIYVRVSTKEQAEGGYSIPAQREACLKFIQDKGWTFIDEYVDRGESARSAQRPQLQEMLSRIKKDKSIDCVIVHKIDRLARNMEDHVAIKAIFKKENVSFVSVVEVIEDSASGQFLESILQKAKSGGCPYKAPVGYKHVRESQDSKSASRVEIDNETAPHIHMAFRLYATGDYSLGEIREILEKKGLRNQPVRNKPPKPICKGAVASILSNKFYIGVITFKGVDYQGEHETFIDKMLFQRVQDMIRAKDTAGERKRKHPHYLKGTLFCGECGSKLSFMLAKGQYPYFYCLGQKRHNGCSQPYIEVGLIETKIENLYAKMRITPKRHRELQTYLEEEMIARSADSLRERKTLTKTIDNLTGERYKLIKAYYAEAINIDLLKTEQMRLDAEIMLAEERLETVDVKADQVQTMLEKTIGLASKCRDAYLGGKPATRRLFNQAFFEGIYVKDGKIQKAQYTELFAVIFSPRLNKDTLVGLGGHYSNCYHTAYIKMLRQLEACCKHITAV